MQRFTLPFTIHQAEGVLPLNTPKSLRLQTDQPYILLFRTAKGIFASEAFCPHAGASLKDSHFNSEGDIICPLHSYCFDTQTGKEKTGKNCKELVLYPVTVNEDGSLTVTVV